MTARGLNKVSAPSRNQTLDFPQPCTLSLAPSCTSFPSHVSKFLVPLSIMKHLHVGQTFTDYPSASRFSAVETLIVRLRPLTRFLITRYKSCAQQGHTAIVKTHLCKQILKHLLTANRTEMKVVIADVINCVCLIFYCPCPPPPFHGTYGSFGICSISLQQVSRVNIPTLTLYALFHSRPKMSCLLSLVNSQAYPI